MIFFLFHFLWGTVVVLVSVLHENEERRLYHKNVAIRRHVFLDETFNSSVMGTTSQHLVVAANETVCVCDIVTSVRSPSASMDTVGETSVRFELNCLFFRTHIWFRHFQYIESLLDQTIFLYGTITIKQFYMDFNGEHLVSQKSDFRKKDGWLQRFSEYC